MLKITDLHVRYGGIHSVKGISLSIPRGSIVTLIGANGAGKTTTVKTICGLNNEFSGSIQFENLEITNQQTMDIIKSGISMVPEGRRIFSNLTVYENLQLGAIFRNDPAEFNSNLEFVYYTFPRLKERLRQKGATLSGGEQQMLAVGRALMANPRLILMDEPSLGLAPILVQEIFAIVKKIHEEGVTIMLIEQNAYGALKIADYAYVLENGKIVLEGPGADLLHDERIKHSYLG